MSLTSNFGHKYLGRFMIALCAFVCNNNIHPNIVARCRMMPETPLQYLIRVLASAFTPRAIARFPWRPSMTRSIQDTYGLHDHGVVI